MITMIIIVTYKKLSSVIKLQKPFDEHSTFNTMNHSSKLWVSGSVSFKTENFKKMLHEIVVIETMSEDAK